MEKLTKISMDRIKNKTNQMNQKLWQQCEVNSGYNCNKLIGYVSERKDVVIECAITNPCKRRCIKFNITVCGVNLISGKCNHFNHFSQ